MRTEIFLSIICFFIPSIAVSATLKVPSQYPTIQDAIDDAVRGDIVLVAPGTYVENIDFKGKAITVKSEQGPAMTVIDGNQNGSVVRCQSREDENSVLYGFVLTNGRSSHSGGMHNTSSSPTVTNCAFFRNSAVYSGGGMTNYNSNPAVTNCVFFANSAYDGGGMSNWSNSSPIVTNCIFTGNSATKGAGGGMINYDYCSPTVVNCTFSGNSAGWGGGIHNDQDCNPTVTYCTFTGNSAGWGGGIGNWSRSSPIVTHCTFTGNSAPNGGGMLNYESSSPIVTHCTITGNSAPNGDGGGMCNCHNSNPTVKGNIISGNTSTLGGGIICKESHPEISNNIISDNKADQGGGIWCRESSPKILNNMIYTNSAKKGGGIDIWFKSTPSIINNTIVGNSAEKGGGIACRWSSVTEIIDSILWDNDGTTGKEIYIKAQLYPSIVSIDFSDLEGGQASVYVDPNCTLKWGSGMIDADPLFVDPANGDCHLTYPSPCRDAGDKSAVTERFDFEGDPRIAYGTVDMGADEFYTHLYWTGDGAPGGNVEIKFVGLPGTAPVGLCIGTGVLDPPIPSMWGDWYLKFPIFGPIVLPAPIPSTGVLAIPGSFPATPPAPYSIPMQVLIGAELTNLSVLEVK